MKKVNLIDIEKSDINYRIDRFPDGEVQFLFTEELNRKDNYEVECRITNAEELFLVLQIGDILDRQAVEWDLHIRYLMGMRMDRVMSFERPFTLSVVGKMISSMNYVKCVIDTPHSDRTIKEIRNSVGYDIDVCLWAGENQPGSYIVYPDKGAMERYKVDGHTTYFEKERDIATGKIKSFIFHDNFLKKHLVDNIIVVDDLCDAGGTFLGELAVMKEKYPNAKFSIRVTHLVNEKGLDNLCKNFDTVYVTNSYKDWDKIAKEKGYNNLIVDVM